MTRKENKVRKREPARAFLCISSLLLLALMLAAPKSASREAREALRLISGTLVPSLFPFMVIADVLQRCGFVDSFGRLWQKPMQALFGIGRGSGGAMLLGVLCGSPVAARCVISLYDRGELSENECERLLAMSALPSAAFAVSAVGGSLFMSARIGAELYIACLLSAIIVGAVDCRLTENKSGKSKVEPKKNKAPADIGIGEISEAISSSAVGVVKISGFVLFFSVLLGVLFENGIAERLPKTLTALAYAALELTSGVAKAASCENGKAALCLCAFALGWSSLSVHFQIMNTAQGRNIRFSRYLALKTIQSVTCTLLVLVRTLVFDVTVTPSAKTVLTLSMPDRIRSAILAIFCFSLLLAIAKKARPW